MVNIGHLELEPNKYFLGKLCRYKHYFKDTQSTLRYLSKTKGCVTCRRLNSAQERSKPVVFSKEDIERFWSKATCESSKNGCIEWTGAKDQDGYGVFQKHKTHRANRLAYIFTFGQIEGELIVCHQCDNPGCVNPHHLFLGTHMDNAIDRVSKGRSGIFNRQFIYRMQGENNGRAILNQTKANEIRHKHKNKIATQSTLAHEYGVAVPTIKDILKGKTWNYG